MNTKLLSPPLTRYLALAAVAAWPTASALAQNMWTNVTGDYNVPTSWFSNSVPTGNVNAFNDNGANNVVLIQAGDPVWSHGDTRAGNGANTSGAYLQTGSTNITGISAYTSWLRLGLGTNSVGYYTLSNGLCQVAGNVEVGEIGTGYLKVAGGVLNQTNNSSTSRFTLADAPNFGSAYTAPVGTLEIDGGTVTVAANTLVVGDAQNSSSRLGTGNLLMNGGTLNHAGNANFVVGRQGGKGNIVMTGGVLNQTNAAGILRFAVAATTAGTNVSVGTLTMSGGTINCAGELDLATDNNGTADGGGACATNNMSGGTINIGSWLAIGRNGSVGVWNMTGGSVTELGTVSGVAVTIGCVVNAQGPSIGIVNQSGGNFTNTAMPTWIGENGQGTWTLSGSGLAVLGVVHLSQNSGAVGVFNLNGGDLIATQISGPGGNGTFNFNGGRLHASASSTTFMQNLQAAYVLDGGALIDTGTNNITIPQNIYAGGSGIGGLTKVGSGTLVLGGANLYSGSTVVSNGTLAVASTGLNGGGALVVRDSAQFILTNTGAAVYASALTLGPGNTTLQFNLPTGNPASPAIVANNLSASGSATINITGQALLPGQFTLIQFTSASGLGNFHLGTLPPGVSATLVQTATSLDLNVQSAGKQLAWDGTANNQWDTSSLNWMDLNNANALTAYSQPNGFGDLVTFDDTATGTTAISLGLAVSPVSMTFNNNGWAYSFTGPGKITGLTAVTLNGWQSVSLGTSNDYTNGTLVNAGLLYVGADQALGLGPVTLNLGTLASASTAGHTLPNWIILNGNSVILGDTVNTGPLTLSGKLDLAGGTGRTLNFNSDIVVSGSLSNGGFTTKTGPGRLIIQGNSQQSALVTQQQGDVIIDGARLDSGDGWRLENYFSGTTLRLALTNGGTFTLAVNTGNIRVGLSGGDNYSDNVLDIAGTMNLRPSSGGVAGNSAVLLGASGANDYLYLRTGGLLMCRAIVGGGPANTEAHFQGGTLMPLADEANFLLGLTNAFVENGGLTIDTTNFNVTIAQALVAGGSGGLTKLGTGNLTLNGADTYTGPTAVNAGKLILGSAHAATGPVTVLSNATLAFVSSGPNVTVSVPSVSGADGALLEAQFNGLTANPTTPAAYINNLALNGTVGANVLFANIKVGQFPLFGYNTLSGTGRIVPGQLPHGVVATIVTNTTAKTIDLVVTSVNPLLWAGTLSSTWNTSTTNWSLLGVPSLYSQNDNVQFDDSALGSSVTMTQAVTPSSVLFSNNSLAYTLGASGSGKLSGTTGLIKDGTNSLTLSSANDFTGDVTVKAGMLILGNATALGATNGSTYINSGATLNMKDIRLATQLKTIYVIGQGYNNLGALYSDSGTSNGDFFRDLRLLGDTWVGAAAGARFGFTDPSARLTCVGGPYKFTKVGTGIFDFEDATITLGEVEVREGVLQVANNTAINTGYGITLQSGTELRIYNLLAPLGRPITVNNALVNTTQGTGSQLSGNITLNTAGTFQVGGGFALTTAGAITGSGDLIKTTAGLLTLNGVNTYTGSTYVQGGTLALGASGSVATTPLLLVSAGATLDVSALAPWALGASQTLAGAGIINGSVQANGTVAPGSAIATLTFNNDLTLAGTNVMKVSKDGGLTNDLITVSGTLTYGGQLQVVLTGSTPLTTNDTFKLFNFTSAPAGSFAHISLPAGYTWDTTQLAATGTIKVTGVLNPPQPRIATVSIINGAIVLSGTNGASGSSFTLLGSTNVALPLAQWLPVSTNTFDASGNFSVTNLIDPNKQQMFFRLQ